MLDNDKRDPYRFRIVQRTTMGKGRTTGKKNPGFIDSVLDLINDFYGQVVQNLTPWTPPAPKMKRPAALTETPEPGSDLKDDHGAPEQPSATGEPPTCFAPTET